MQEGNITAGRITAKVYGCALQQKNAQGNGLLTRSDRTWSWPINAGLGMASRRGQIGKWAPLEGGRWKRMYARYIRDPLELKSLLTPQRKNSRFRMKDNRGGGSILKRAGCLQKKEEGIQGGRRRCIPRKGAAPIDSLTGGDYKLHKSSFLQSRIQARRNESQGTQRRRKTWFWRPYQSFWPRRCVNHYWGRLAGGSHLKEREGTYPYLSKNHQRNESIEKNLITGEDSKSLLIVKKCA